MSNTEERSDKLERRVGSLEQQVATVATKVDMVIGELQQQREDMRRLQERQDEDRRKHDADMRELREDIKASLRHIQGLTIASMVGISAIAVGVLGFLWSTARNMNMSQSPPAQTAQYQTAESPPK